MCKSCGCTKTKKCVGDKCKAKKKAKPAKKAK